MSDMASATAGTPSAQRVWEEWLERTSTEQIRILRENNRKKDLRTRRKRNLLRISRFVLPAAVAAVIVFLCVAPTGRALANAAMRNITKTVGHFFYLQSADVGKPTAGAEATAAPAAVPSGLSKIEEAFQRVQKPLLYIAGAGLVISDVKVSMDDASSTVQIEYLTTENDSIITYQKINNSQANWGAAMDAFGTAPITHVLYNGETMYCTYTQEGRAFGSARWGDIFFSISSPTLKWEKLLESVDALACIQ